MRIKTSLAASISLGMEPGQFSRGKGCTCLNILLNYDSGCLAHCAYCGLAANKENGTSAKRESGTKNRRPTFIRVRWPSYSLEDIINKIKEGHHPFKRVCVSMVTHPNAVGDTCEIIRAFTSQAGLPVSALLSPTVMNGKEDMMRIKEAGADRAGIAIDAATEQLFDSLRGRGLGGPHRWERYLQAVDEAVTVFGAYKTGVHLIVGLGETEKEMIETIVSFHDRGALTHLFSFYPEPGSVMERHPRPTIGSYRRIQLARYLINETDIIQAASAGKTLSSADAFIFSERGELVDFRVDIRPFIEKGDPFMTSGCPGKDGLMACNRPYSNERPSEPIRNYHFMPDEDDKKMIAAQILED